MLCRTRFPGHYGDLPARLQPSRRSKAAKWPGLLQTCRDQDFLAILDVWPLCCSFPRGPKLPDGHEIFFRCYRETDSLVVLGVQQLARSLPGSPKPPGSQEIVSQNCVESKISLSFWVSGTCSAVLQEVQSRQMATGWEHGFSITLHRLRDLGLWTPPVWGCGACVGQGCRSRDLRPGVSA